MKGPARPACANLAGSARLYFCSISRDVAQRAKLKTLPVPARATTSLGRRQRGCQPCRLPSAAGAAPSKISTELIICIQIGSRRFPEALPAARRRSPTNGKKHGGFAFVVGLGQLTQQWAMFVHENAVEHNSISSLLRLLRISISGREGLLFTLGGLVPQRGGNANQFKPAQRAHVHVLKVVWGGWRMSTHWPDLLIYCLLFRLV